MAQLSEISITIPHKYITSEVLSLLNEYFYKVYEEFESERDILRFIEDIDGDISEVEDLLVSKGIPFNMACSDLELERKFRPARDGMEMIDVEINSVHGNVVIRTDVIRKLLKDSKNPEITLQKIEQALLEVDPEVSPLSEWVKMAIPIVSTAEIEDDRFSDIL